MSTEAIIALASLGLNLLVALAGFTIGIRRIGEKVEEKIESHRIIFDGEMDTVRREVGEIATAIRSKIQEVELFTRDTFVRRDSFMEAMRGFGTDMRSQFDKIDARLERMEAKIDTKN